MASIKDAEQTKKPAAQVAYAEKAAALKAASTDTTDNQARPETLLSKREVLARVGVTFPTLWTMMRKSRFPAARDLNGSRPAWLASEVEAWIAALPTRKYKAAAGEAEAEQSQKTQSTNNRANRRRARR